MGFIGYLVVLFISSIPVHWFLRIHFALRITVLTFGGTILVHIVAGLMGDLDAFFLLTFFLSLLYSAPVAFVAGLVVLATKKIIGAN